LNGRKDIGCGGGTEFANGLGLMVCHMAKESFFWCL
jgi:hypothetical protein